MNVECCTIHEALKDLLAEHVRISRRPPAVRGEPRRSKCQRRAERRRAENGEGKGKKFAMRLISAT